MKTVVVLCVLVLALVGGAAAGKKSEEKKKTQEVVCKEQCLEKGLPESTCKEGCTLNVRFRRTWIEALQCSLKCSKKHGLGAPATKPCEEGCKKKYDEKVAEMGVSCHGFCTKAEKDQPAVEKCKKICTPSLIFKEMQEKAAEDKTTAAAAAAGAN